MSIGHLLDFLIGTASLAVLPYFSFVLLTTLAAILVSKRVRSPSAPVTYPDHTERRFLVVIPARDEARVIAKTLESAMAIDYPAELFNVLVIADNCTDDTAERAKGRGTGHCAIRFFPQEQGLCD